MSKRLLYLTTWDFSNEESDGVCKKINNQKCVLNKAGFLVDSIYVKGNDLLFEEDSVIRCIGKLGKIKKTPAYYKMYKYICNKKYDCVYNRFGMFDTFYCKVLKSLHRNGAKILVEIPTYPYVGERNKGLANSIMYWWDQIYHRSVYKFIDRIATYTWDKTIWGIPTIHIQNGIKIDDYKIKKCDNLSSSDVNFVGVALLQPYHGYERILEGMRNYYYGNPVRKVFFHIIGDGPEKSYYENLVELYQLSDYVTFYGRMNNQEMDPIFDKADIGVCSLGIYKKGVTISSELKSKEFMARGIPFIFGCDLDIESSLDSSMIRKYPNDESVITVESILEFVDKTRMNYVEISQSMRERAYVLVSMDETMKPMIDYMEN